MGKGLMTLRVITGVIVVAGVTVMYLTPQQSMKTIMFTRSYRDVAIVMIVQGDLGIPEDLDRYTTYLDTKMSR